MISRRSLAFRLFAGAAAWAVALLLLGAVALTSLYQRSVQRTMDDRLGGVVTALISAAETDETGEVVLVRRPTDPLYGQYFSGRYWQIVENDGSRADDVLLFSPSLWDALLHVPAALIDGTRTDPGLMQFLDGEGPDSERVRMAAQALQLPGREDYVLVMAVEDRQPADRDVRNFAVTSGIMFLAFAAAIAAGVFFQVRIGLAPVLRMRNRVADVREGRTDRVDGQYPDELQPLANELNAMLDHSQALVERSRTHVGNLAHALKTPLAVLTNEARQSEGDMADLVTRQTDVMAKQVDHHLRRARAAAHAKALGARTELAPLITNLGRTLEKIYRERGVTVSLDLEPDLFFRGEGQDVEEMAGNLMDNACKWAASEIVVTTRSETGGRLVLSVEDDGPGLDKEGCETAMKRGVRLDEQAPGTGLGLSIVSDLAKAYDGQVDLGRSKAGGLRVELNLPASPR